MFTPSIPLTLSHAEEALNSGLSAIQSGETAFNLSDIGQIDSTTIAILLAWTRAAKARNQAFTCHHTPTALQNLADLYGVSDLLPISHQYSA